MRKKKENGWWPPRAILRISMPERLWIGVYISIKYEMNTIRLWIHKRLRMRCLGLWYDVNRRKPAKFYEVHFSSFFWQSLCHSNGLRKIRKKCTVSSLSQLFFARLLFSEAAGNLKVHLCLLCIIGNYEIMLENLFSVLLHCRLPQRQCSAGGSSGIHVMCVLILMCHREPHLRFAAVNIKMQIFEKKERCFSIIFDLHSLTWLENSSAEFEAIKTYGIPTKKKIIAASTTCATTREVLCSACQRNQFTIILFLLTFDYRIDGFSTRTNHLQTEWLMIISRFPKFGRGAANGSPDLFAIQYFDNFVNKLNSNSTLSVVCISFQCDLMDQVISPGTR